MGDCLLKKGSFLTFFVNFILLSLFLILSSCISFDLDSFKDQKAENVRFTPPLSPYQPVFKKGMDASWYNQKNKHSISFFSNCVPYDKWNSLHQFQKEILSELKNFHIFKTKKTIHQKMTAHHLWLKTLSAKNSTSSQNMELFLFQNKNCFYVLISLTKMETKNMTSTQEFQNFIQGFKAL